MSPANFLFLVCRREKEVLESASVYRAAICRRAARQRALLTSPHDNAYSKALPAAAAADEEQTALRQEIAAAIAAALAAGNQPHVSSNAQAPIGQGNSLEQRASRPPPAPPSASLCRLLLAAPWIPLPTAERLLRLAGGDAAAAARFALDAAAAAAPFAQTGTGPAAGDAGKGGRRAVPTDVTDCRQQAGTVPHAASGRRGGGASESQQAEKGCWRVRRREEKSPGREHDRDLEDKSARPSQQGHSAAK